MKKTTHVTVRLIADEDKIVTFIVGHEHLKRGELIQELIRNHAKTPGIWPPDSIENESEGKSLGRGPP